MASKWTDEQQKFLNQTFTIKGRILFPNLLVAKAKEAGKRELFDVQFAWNPSENAQIMQQLMAWYGSAIQMFHTGLNPAALLNPLKASGVPGMPEYQRQDAKPNPAHLHGLMWVNASSGKDFPPQVVKQSPMGLIKLTAADEAEVYSGRNAVINISFYPIIPQPGAANQKRGFSVNVNAVLLLDGGDKVGGSASVDVNSVFGGFAQDMGMAPAFGSPAAFNPGQQAPMGNSAHPATSGQMPSMAPNLGTQAPFNAGSAPTAYPSSQPTWPPQQQQQQQQQPAMPGFPHNTNFNGQY